MPWHSQPSLSVVTHLGNIIKPGDICAGYDLTCAQFNDEALESYQGLQLPEVILVKKGESNQKRTQSFAQPSLSPVYKKPTGRRTFKLKSLDAEMEGLAPQRVSRRAARAHLCRYSDTFSRQKKPKPETTKTFSTILSKILKFVRRLTCSRIQRGWHRLQQPRRRGRGPWGGWMKQKMTLLRYKGCR